MIHAWLRSQKAMTERRDVAGDHPDGVSACKMCTASGCGDCFTGKCNFVSLEWGEGETHPSIAGPGYTAKGSPEGKQDMCTDWTWTCGATQLEAYFDCSVYSENLGFCDECEAGCGGGDCFVGICDDYCKTRSFSCDMLPGLKSCAKLRSGEDV